MAKLKSTQVFGNLTVDGEITNKATISTEGVTKLNDAISSTSTTEAATANAVKKAYDKANHAHPYSASDHNHDTTYVKASGSTMTGVLTLSGNPTANLHAATKQYVDSVLGTNDAMVFKGSIDCSASPNYPDASAGFTYKVSVAGKIGGASGINVELNDTMICTKDSSAAGTHATVGANWIILQSNIDGAVIGPSSSTASAVAIFDGTTGKVLKNSGFTIGKSVPSNAVFTDTQRTLATTTTALASGGTGVVGTSTNVARQDHTHTLPAYPTSLPANGGNADSASKFLEVDTRGTNQNPQWYMTNKGKSVVYEFKSTTTVGLKAAHAEVPAYAEVSTYTSWGDSSGGYPVQFATCNTGLYYRTSTNATTWGAWEKIATKSYVTTELAKKANTTHHHDAAYVNASGDTMTGKLTVPSMKIGNYEIRFNATNNSLDFVLV